jgi:hypothetical protein
MSMVLTGQRPSSTRQAHPRSQYSPDRCRGPQTEEIWNDSVATLSLLVAAGIIMYLVFRL